MPAGAEAGSLALNTGTDILTYRVPALDWPSRKDGTSSSCARDGAGGSVVLLAGVASKTT
jgi:hypothetical protein